MRMAEKIWTDSMKELTGYIFWPPIPTMIIFWIGKYNQQGNNKWDVKKLFKVYMHGRVGEYHAGHLASQSFPWCLFETESTCSWSLHLSVYCVSYREQLRTNRQEEATEHAGLRAWKIEQVVFFHTHAQCWGHRAVASIMTSLQPTNGVTGWDELITLLLYLQVC